MQNAFLGRRSGCFSPGSAATLRPRRREFKLGAPQRRAAMTPRRRLARNTPGIWQSGARAAMSHLICDYLDELRESLGAVQAPVDPRVLRRLYERQDYGAMLGWIKNSMRLDLSVGLRIVEGPAGDPLMWVEMPEPMPIYGSAEFRRVRVIVNARRYTLHRSFACAVAGFSHELSHVVLAAMRHRLRADEKAVDLAAMLLGYQAFVGNAEFTQSKGALQSLLLTMLLLPFGLLVWRGPAQRIWRLGALTHAEAAAARQRLALWREEPPR
jgi:hypothetical protein